MKRREFLTTTLAASALTGLGTGSLTARAAAPERAGGRNREYYELRIYRLRNPANRGLLEGYIEKAAIPALNRLGVKPVGVFVQQERTGAPDPTELRDASTVLVLRTYPSLEV